MIFLNLWSSDSFLIFTVVIVLWLGTCAILYHQLRLHPLPILSIEEMKVLAQVIHKWSWQLLPRWKVQFHLPMWFLVLYRSFPETLPRKLLSLQRSWGDNWITLSIRSPNKKKTGEFGPWGIKKVSHYMSLLRTSANIHQALWFRHLIAELLFANISYATHCSVFRNPMGTEASGS